MTRIGTTLQNKGLQKFQLYQKMSIIKYFLQPSIFIEKNRADLNDFWQILTSKYRQVLIEERIIQLANQFA